MGSAPLDDPATAGRVLSNRHIGEVPLDRAIDRFYTSDAFMHAWDLARATGQDDRLDLDTCAALLAGMEPIEEVMRSSGQYGARVPVPADADAQTRLLGFIGRDPNWTPAATGLLTPSVNRREVAMPPRRRGASASGGPGR